ncbi:MAG: hypothetical protein IKN54_02280 [Lachnospiraceae bacterium]|nr:hypothetical protein [Lachnospiraceae bacterium]
MENNAVLNDLLDDIRRTTDAEKINRLWLKGYLTMTEAKEMIMNDFLDSKYNYVILYKENKPGKRYKKFLTSIYKTRTEAEEAIPNWPQYSFKLKKIPIKKR